MKKTENTIEWQQARNAFWFGAFLTIIVTIILALSYLEDMRNNAKFFSLTNGLVGVALISSLLLVWLSRIKRHVWGVIQLCIMIIAVSIGVTIKLAGFGLVLGIASLFVFFLLTATSLPSKLGRRMMVIGLIGSLAVIFLDLFFPIKRDTPDLARNIPYLMGVLILAFVVLLTRQFRNFTLRIKFILGIVGITLLSIAAVAISNNYLMKRALTDQTGQTFKNLIDAQASRVGGFMESKVSNLEAFALSVDLVEAVQTANLTYLDKTNAEIRAEIAELDQIWRAADAANDTGVPLLRDRLNNPTAKTMQEFSITFPDNIEVFITDRYGASIGAYTYVPSGANYLGRPSDYDQSDEAWWQAAYNNGVGKVYIGVPEYDESVKATTIIIAIPILQLNTGETLGILRTTISLKALEDFLTTKIGETGEIDLIFPGESPQHLHAGIFEPVDLQLVDELDNAKSNFFSMVYEGVPSFVSQATVFGGPKYVNDLGWRLVLHQPEKEAVAPVAEQTRAVTILAVVIALMVAGIAGGLSQVLAAPVSRLTVVAEKVAGGDLSVQAQVESEDEIGRLASTFNKMTGELKSTLADLEQRVADRTQAIETAAVVGRRISTLLDIRQLAVEIVQQLQQAFNYYHVHIYLYDDQKENLVMMSGTGEAGQIMLSQNHKIPRGRGLVGRSSDTGSIVLVSDTSKDPNWLPNSLLPETKSEIVVPIMIGDDVLGALDVQQNTVNGLTQQDVGLLQLVSSQVAVAIRNARLYASAEKRAKEERNISAIIDQIQSTTSIEDALQVTTREVGRFLKVPHTQVSLKPTSPME